MAAQVIRLRNKQAKRAPEQQDWLARWCLNGLFLLDGAWHIWALMTNHTEFTLVSKFLLGLVMAALLRQQLGSKLPASVLIAILFCLTGDVLLQPLDLDYTNMQGDRPVHFVLGVICFCIAYGHLAQYLLTLIPDWQQQIRMRPSVCIVNGVMTILLLTWMTIYNQAPPALLVVLWLYSPIVVGIAVLSTYIGNRVGLFPFLALVAGCIIIVFSDTIIGLTVFTKIGMPWVKNAVWILSTYIFGLFLVFNAIISIEKRAEISTG